MATPSQAPYPEDSDYDAWGDLGGRWFFAWWMAAACQEALREVHLAMGRHPSTARRHALERASQLFRQEMVRWLRRGEALDMIVQHLPTPPEWKTGETDPGGSP